MLKVINGVEQESMTVNVQQSKGWGGAVCACAAVDMLKDILGDQKWSEIKAGILFNSNSLVEFLYNGEEPAEIALYDGVMTFLKMPLQMLIL